MNKDQLINSSYEFSYRLIFILNKLNGNKLSINELTLLDYFVTYTSDFNQDYLSLHPLIPNRENELMVRRLKIREATEILLNYNLISINYEENGMFYSNNFNTIYFENYFESNYSKSIIENLTLLNESNYREIVQLVKENTLLDRNFYKNNDDRK